MRIVAGQFKGRSLTSPKTRNTRPTSDRARESLFNILAHAAWAPALEGASVIDLFAGSGALGLEALSRGAAQCLLVETARSAQAAIRDNIKALNVESRAKLLSKSAASLGPMPELYADGFDLAFLDPPYHKNLVTPCLDGLIEGKWLKVDALVVVETAREEKPDFGRWDILNTRESGAATFWFLKTL